MHTVEDLHITEAQRQHAVGMLVQLIPVFLDLTCTTQRWGKHNEMEALQTTQFEC